MKTRRRLAVLLTVALALLACVTINVYFPEAAIKDLSEQIEEEVQKAAEEGEAGSEAGAPEQTQEEPGEETSLLDLVLGVSPAHAQENVPAPEASNPAIRKIIDSRAGRLAALNKFKAQGVIGESNEALVVIRKLDAVEDLRQRAEVQRLVRAENADREQLYKEIAVAKKVDPSQLPKIRQTYAETLRRNARPGDLIQLPDGTWQKK